jgi:hypothetical protein
MDKDEILFKINADISKEQAALRQGVREFETFGTRAKTIMGNVNRAVESATKNFGALGTAATALGSGLVLKKIFGVGEYMPVEKSLLRIQANLGASLKQIAPLKEGLESLAIKHGEDPGEMFSKAAEFSAFYKGDELLKVMTNSANAATALGKDLGPVADLVSRIEREFGLSVDATKEISETLGATSLGEHLEEVSGIMQKGVLKGITGMKGGYKEALGILEGLNRAGEMSPRAVQKFITAWNALSENKESIKAKTGFDVKGGQIGILEQLDAKIKKMRAEGKSEGDILNWIASNRDEAEAVMFMVKQLDALKAGIKATYEPGDKFRERFEAMDKSLERVTKRIKVAAKTITLDFQPAFDAAGKALGVIAEHPAIVKGGVLAAAGASLGMLGMLAKTKLGGVVASMAGRGALGAAGTEARVVEGKILQATQGVTPVFVVNWPAGGFGGMGGVAAEGAESRLILMAKSALPFLGPIALPLAAAVAAGLAINYMGKREVKEESEARKVTLQETVLKQNEATARATGRSSMGSYVDVNGIVHNDIHMMFDLSGRRPVVTSNDPNTRTHIEGVKADRGAQGFSWHGGA